MTCALNNIFLYCHSHQVMLNFIPDVYINTDQCRGSNAGKSPGFGISLVAETNEKTFYCAESVSITQNYLYMYYLCKVI